MLIENRGDSELLTLDISHKMNQYVNLINTLAYFILRAPKYPLNLNGSKQNQCYIKASYPTLYSEPPPNVPRPVVKHPVQDHGLPEFEGV
jgi:hypothetical protein